MMTRTRKIVSIATIGVAMIASYPARSAVPPVIVAATGAYVLPYVEVKRGESITIYSDATPGGHTFTTSRFAAGLCDDPAGSAPVPCHVPVPELGKSVIKIDADAQVASTWNFYCLNHVWMTGQLTVGQE